MQASREIVQTPGSTYGGAHTLEWQEKPRNVLMITKCRDTSSEKALVTLARWLHQTRPEMNLVVEKSVAEACRKSLPQVHTLDPEDYSETIDFAITLGGDGTLLRLSSLFPKAAPPVLSFSLGTLCFLKSYSFDRYQEILGDMMAGNIGLTMRMRLFCSLHQHDGQRIRQGGKRVQGRQVMNEVSLHRGRYPHLTSIDCRVNGHYLTECIADGLIVSTPTGSTAYSLSAGGPIVHPTVQSLVLTPICPRSLSFRTVLLPSSSVIELKVSSGQPISYSPSLDWPT
ncbi:ATP-NAD kinase-like domain-containing protein [Sporodiniella umbellata]|nr:ATP-NAD kinase-like domain-containing protein [Sporodiniella umbellata]